MKKCFSLMVVMALVGLPGYAQKDENNRIRNAGKVMVEILNVPDDIPADILDKAECVIVLPSVMKVCDRVRGQLWPRRDDLPERQGVQRTLERAFDDGARRGKLRLAVGRPGDRLCLAGDESSAGLIRFSPARSSSAATWLLQPDRRAATLQPPRMSPCGQKFCRIRVRADCSQGSLWKAQLFAPITMATRGFTEKAYSAKDIVINSAIRAACLGEIARFHSEQEVSEEQVR